MATAKKPVAPKKAPAKKAAPVAKKKEPTVKKPVAAAKAPAKISDAPKAAPAPKKEKEKDVQPRIRIKLSAFDHTVLDEAAQKILETSERSGAVVHGPIPLPTHIKKFTVNRSTFVHKDARDQFEMRIHRRLIDLTETTFKTVESLQSLSLPSGVDIEIKMG
jgi:small subunit ribosomal protein S10